MSTRSPPTTTFNSISSLLHSIRRRPSPIVQRLLELCVQYQQQQADAQNALPSASVALDSATYAQEAEKRIQSLVKALTKSKRTGSIDELEQAILHSDATKPCILVPRSFDASHSERGQSTCVVGYCRLWRWSDLSDANELKPIDRCAHAFQYHHDDVCVNPWHYERRRITYSVSVPVLPTPISPPVTSSFAPATPMDVETTSHQSIALEELDEWCHIAYYEMSQRIGGQYNASRSQVTVDGFLNPSSADRFCLGNLTNIQRTSDIERVRMHIGHGVKFYHIHGNVYAECLSNNPIYVQSPIANRMKSWHPATVCKILPHDRFQIFDSENFAEVLDCAIHEDYAAVHNLAKICTIRMSFVKGWGVDYERSTVTSTPCWIEIHLDAPLKSIDRVISMLPGPIESTTSAS